MPAQDGLYWLAEANLFLGVWEGAHQDRSGWWLRWWDADGQMLLWGEELIQQERQKAEQVQRSAIAKLTDLGLSVEQIADTLSLSVEDVQPQLEN